MFKMALFDCAINEKYCSVDGGWSICLFFFIPTPGELTAQGSSPTGNFPSKAENIANARGSARAGRGGGGVWA